MKKLQFREIAKNTKIENHVNISIHLITWKFAGKDDHAIAFSVPTSEGLSVKYFHKNKLKYYPPFWADIDEVQYLIIGNRHKDDLSRGLKKFLNLNISYFEVNNVIRELIETNGPEETGTVREFIKLIEDNLDLVISSEKVLKVPKH